MPLLRVPFTEPLPHPRIIPRSAITTSGAVQALVDFLSASSSPSSHHRNPPNQTVVLTGAGVSVASGLADYRGTNGTYTLNKTYRPIYFNEFCANHEARKRYWARSFMGWTTLDRAQPNEAHKALGNLGNAGYLSSIITQNVDSFHRKAHPSLPTIELHGYLRALVCLTCRKEYSRAAFQQQLSSLNPAWAEFLATMLSSGALNTENPEERRKRGLKTNPDGDVDIPDAPYTTFRYPACPVCLENAHSSSSATHHDDTAVAAAAPLRVDIDSDGAWLPTSTGGILKPAVIMFGESISAATKAAAERAIDDASRVLIVGSSLATYSAWRLVKRARESGMPIAIVNLGGVRGEDVFFVDHADGKDGRNAVRCSESAEKVLPRVVEGLKAR